VRAGHARLALAGHPRAARLEAELAGRDADPDHLLHRGDRRGDPPVGYHDQDIYLRTLTADDFFSAQLPDPVLTLSRPDGW
jgi:hypothetical protein